MYMCSIGPRCILLVFYTLLIHNTCIHGFDFEILNMITNKGGGRRKEELQLVALDWSDKNKESNREEFRGISR